jgi:peroxiredoxin
MGCTFAPVTLTPSREATPTNAVNPAPTATPVVESSPTPVPESEPALPPVGARKGNTAIDFTLPSLQGQDVKLSDLRGKAVLVNFWAVWCGYCRVEMPDLQAAFEAYGDNELVVLGIDVQESAQVVEPFVEQLGITFPILLDQKGEVTIAYNVRGLPTSVFIDPQGIIRFVHLGPLTRKNIDNYLALLENG